MLLEGNVEVFKQKNCTQTWANFNTITRNMVCASGPNRVPEICFYDSGGPLQCQNKRTGKWFVVGLASYSGQFCEELPGVFSYVPTKLRWIRKKIGW